MVTLRSSRSVSSCFCITWWPLLNGHAVWWRGRETTCQRPNASLPTRLWTRSWHNELIVKKIQVFIVSLKSKCVCVHAHACSYIYMQIFKWCNVPMAEWIVENVQNWRTYSWLKLLLWELTLPALRSLRTSIFKNEWNMFSISK